MYAHLFRRAALGAFALTIGCSVLLGPARPAAAQADPFRDLPIEAPCAACPYDDVVQDYVDSDSDSDGDGLLDGDEVSVFGTDPWLGDTDGDGYGDGYEIYPCSGGVATNPLNPADFFDPIGCLT